MAKHFLEFEEEYDFDVIGIASHERNYRVCWEINRILDITLVLRPEDEDKENMPKAFEHTVYHYSDSILKRNIHLICNQQDNSVLIPELKNLSYFLHLENVDSENLNTIIQLLQNSKLILTVTKLDVALLKSRQRFIF